MSRAQHPSQDAQSGNGPGNTSSGRGSGRSRARLLVAALGVVGAVSLAGCSSGQIAQTAEQESAVNGASADVGPIAIRDATLAAPQNKGQFYAYGDDGPLALSVINTASADDKLVSVASPIAKHVRVTGSRAIPGHTTLRCEARAKAGAAASSTPSAAAGSATSSPESATSQPSAGASNGQSAQHSHLILGHVQIVLTGMKVDHFRAGYTAPVTFTFAKAGKVTVNIPIATPDKPDKLDTKGTRG